MTQVSLSTSTNFDGNLNALVEDQGTELTIRLDLDESAPAGGLRIFVDSDVEQIINRLDLPSFAFNPVTQNIDPTSVSTDFDNSGVALTIEEGANFASFTIPVFDNTEPDTTLPSTFDGLVEATLSVVTADEISSEDAADITGISEYTVDSNAASSVVLFADDESQLPGNPQPTSGYDEAVSGDISDDPNSPLELTLAEGTTTLSATTEGSNGDQEYVTVTFPEALQLDTLTLEAFSNNENVGFIGVQEGNVFTEPLDNSADTGNLLGYALFGGAEQVGTDILDDIGNGQGAIGFDGALPSGTYTFALQQLGVDSDYTLAFNTSEATTEPNPPTSEAPVVSFETTPATLSEEAEDNLVEWKWTVTGDFPEEGIVVNLDTSGGNPDVPFDFTNQFAAEPPAEFIDAEIVDSDDETGRINILLSEPEASFKLYFVNDILEEGAQPFDFQLVEGEGYTVDPDQNGTVFTITDDNGGPGVGPTVGISASATDLAEGDPITITFTLDGEIPEDGVQVLVQSPVAGALGQFDLADLSQLELTGIEGLPEVGDAGGSSFFITITEPTATITTSVFNDIVAESALELPFTLANGELYEVDPDAASITLNLEDETAPAGPTIGLTVDKTDVTEGETITLTFNVEGEIPEGGVQVLVNDVASAQGQLRSLTEFDIANIETTGLAEFPTPADGDSGFFINITEPTATITLPVFDEGVDEDEANESFTFEIIDGEAYDVDPDASSITLSISDAEGGGGEEPTVSFSTTPELISEADGTELVLNFSVTGEIPEDGITVNLEGDTAEILQQFLAPDGDGAVQTRVTDDGNVLYRFDTSFEPGAGIEGGTLDVFSLEDGDPAEENSDPDAAGTGFLSNFSFTITEANASITLPVSDDIIQESDQTFTYTLAAGDGYEVDETQNSGTFTVTDGITPATSPTVGVTASETTLIEDEQTRTTITFDTEGDIPESGLLVQLESGVRAIAEFDVNATNPRLPEAETEVEGVVVTGGNIAGTDEVAGSLFFRITDPVATVDVAVFDDDVTEGEENLTFNLLDGEEYEVDSDAAEIAFTIDDSGTPELPSYSEGESSNDIIATATPSGLTADNSTVTINSEILGNFFDPDLSLRTDLTEDVDMYSVELAAGDVLRIDTDAQQIDPDTVDTLARIFDAEGNQLAQNDDGNALDELFADVGFDTYLEYTAETAGTYYVGISSFSNGELDFITDPYDPNIVGSGSGNSSGEYELNLSLNQEVSIEPTVIPDGDGTGPVVSFTAIPSTFDGDDIVTNALVQSVVSDDEDAELTSLITLQLSAEGEIPEEGVEIFLNSNLDWSDRLDAGFGRGVETLGAVYNENGEPTGIRINLTATSALLTLNLESPETVPTDGTETLELSLVPSVGYQADGSTTSLPIYDTLADVPPSATPPTVSIEASETALVESTGNTTTLTFSLSEAPPEEGVLIYVDSETEGVISEFNVFDAVITGADAPFPNGDISGFYLRMTEQTATLEVSAYDETTNPQLTPEDALEGIQEITFSIESGEGYVVSPDSGSIDLTIADNPDSVVIPDPGNGEDDLGLSGNEFNNTIETAIATGLNAENSTYETLATLEVEDILLNPGVPEDEELYFANLQDLTEDVDMYSFDLEAGQTITLDVEADGTGESASLLAPVLRVFDAAGEEQAIYANAITEETVPEATNNASLEFTASTAGTYYAGVSVLGNTFYDANVQGSGSGWIFEDQFEPGAYQLTASLDGDVDDSLEPVFGSIDGDTIEVEGSNQLVFAGDMNDLVDASTGEGNNRIYAGSGDDTLILGSFDRVLAGAGDDSFFATSGGDNTITGGEGADQFWIASAEIPESANTITDFTAGEDVIGIAGLGIGYSDLSITDTDAGILVSTDSADLALFTNSGLDAIASEDNFAFA